MGHGLRTNGIDKRRIHLQLAASCFACPVVVALIGVIEESRIAAGIIVLKKSEAIIQRIRVRGSAGLADEKLRPILPVDSHRLCVPLSLFSGIVPVLALPDDYK